WGRTFGGAGPGHTVGSAAGRDRHHDLDREAWKNIIRATLLGQRSERRYRDTDEPTGGGAPAYDHVGFLRVPRLCGTLLHHLCDLRRRPTIRESGRGFAPIIALHLVPFAALP